MFNYKLKTYVILGKSKKKRVLKGCYVDTKLYREKFDFFKDVVKDYKEPYIKGILFFKNSIRLYCNKMNIKFISEVRSSKWHNRLLGIVETITYDFEKVNVIQTKKNELEFNVGKEE